MWNEESTSTQKQSNKAIYILKVEIHVDDQTSEDFSFRGNECNYTYPAVVSIDMNEQLVVE